MQLIDWNINGVGTRTAASIFRAPSPRSARSATSTCCACRKSRAALAHCPAGPVPTSSPNSRRCCPDIRSSTRSVPTCRPLKPAHRAASSATQSRPGCRSGACSASCCRGRPTPARRRCRASRSTSSCRRPLGHCGWSPRIWNIIRRTSGSPRSTHCATGTARPARMRHDRRPPKTQRAVQRNRPAMRCDRLRRLQQRVRQRRLLPTPGADLGRAVLHRRMGRSTPGRMPPPTAGVYDTVQWSEGPLACDFVFVTDTLLPRVTRCEIDGDVRASDHQPVLLVLA